MQTYTQNEQFYNASMHIDTLSIAKALEAAGTPKKQAEAHARVWGGVISHNIATKTDIQMLIELHKDGMERLMAADKANMDTLLAADKANMELLRTEAKENTAIIYKEISDSKNSILTWIIPLIISLLIAMIGLLLKSFL